jgi:hypothetical protein
LPYPADAPALQQRQLPRHRHGRRARSDEGPTGHGLHAAARTCRCRSARGRRAHRGAAKPRPTRRACRHFAARFRPRPSSARSPAACDRYTLGALYQSVGLARLAEARWLQAAKSAAATNDVEAQAQAQLALGTIYLDVFGLRDDAARALGEAAALYTKLGDNVGAAQAREKASHAKGP